MKENVLTHTEEEHFKSNNIRWFCKKNRMSIKVRDHCQLTSMYRGRAHGKCKKNVEQKQSYSFPLAFHKFRSNCCHLLFKKFF